MNRFGRVLWRGLWATLLIVTALGRAPVPAHAAAFTAFDAASLIAAIDAANANGEPDVITLTDNVTLNAVNNSDPINDYGANGLPTITSPILIDGNGYILQRAAAAPGFRIFYVEGSGDLTLVNLTVSGGYATGILPSGSGLYNAGGRVVITGCTFSGNSAVFNGGGISNRNGTMTVINSTFSSNSADNSNGGGIENGGGTLTVTNSTFSANSSGYYGGGIYNGGLGTVTVTNSTFSANSTGSGGGGIYSSGTLTVTNSTFSANSATGAGISVGGGIYTETGTVTLSNSILASNTTSDGFGDNCGYNVGTFSGSNNLAYPTTDDCPDATNGDPLLGALADNGGPTQTIAITDAASAAIDNADPGACPASDQRYYSRVGTCDIGAYEYGGSAISFIPPSGAKAFEPASIIAGDVSALIITLTSDNVPDLTGAYFVDVLPAAITVTGNGSTTCGAGSVPAGNSTILATGLTIPANGSCTVTVPVTSVALGTHTNTLGEAFTAQTDTTALSGVSADLEVTANPPTLAKAFAPATMTAGGTSALTITVSNPNVVDLTGVSFTDTLPTGVTVGTGAASGTCAPLPTITEGDTQIAVGGVTVPASGSCTISVPVTSATVGTHTNTITQVTTTETGTTALSGASADLTVEAVVAPGVGTVSDPALSKIGTLAPGQLGLPGEQITWTITATPPSDANLTNVVVSDTFRSELRIDGVTTTAGDYTISGQTVTVTIPFLSAGSSVTIQVTTTVLRSPEGGTFTNTVTLSADGGVSLSAEGMVLGVSNLPSTGYPPGE